MSSRLSQDSRHATAMLENVIEENKIHGFVADHVEIVDEFSNGIESRLEICDLSILPLLIIQSFDQEVCEQQQPISVCSTSDDRIHRLLEMFGNNIGLYPLEPFSVVVVNQTVLKDSSRLMNPETEDVHVGVALGRACVQNSLNYLGKITEVERVMGFQRSWEKFLGHCCENFQGRLYDGVDDSPCGDGRELLHEPVEDGAENPAHALLVDRGHADDVVPPRVPARDVRSAASGQPHAGDEDQVDDSPPLDLLPIPPASPVHPLPQDLDGGLSPVGLLGRHVEVVNEDHELLPQGGAKHSLPPLVDLPVDDVLRLVCLGLRREVHEVGYESLPHPPHEPVFHHHRLARPRVPDEQAVVVVLQQRRHDMHVPYCVHGRHQDVLELSPCRDRVVGDRLQPSHPPPLVRIEAPVVHGALVWQRSAHLRRVGGGEERAERLTHRRPPLEVRAAAYRPDERENKPSVHALRRVPRPDPAGLLGVVEGREHALEELEETHHQLRVLGQHRLLALPAEEAEEGGEEVFE
mmetsp:Transcript_1732/g.3680  ORF Transcript_1732/g.3680 Transcript_1732/m.3680 type:complete len:522 (-) Transcript_1732:230-1795(-)